MFLKLGYHAYFLFIVLLLLVLSISFQIMIGVLYQKILRETENMAVTEQKFLKQCKLKFSNCYELNAGEVNTPVFVDKLLNQLQFLGIPVQNLLHLSGQLMLLAVFAAGVGACRGIIDGDSLKTLLPYYILTLFGLYLYFSATSFADVRGKKYAVRTNIMDYLENHLRKHLELVREKEMQQYLVRGEGAKGQEVQENAPKQQEPAFADAEGGKMGKQDDAQDELETLLREFLA